MCGSCTAALTNIGDVLGITVDIEVLGPQAKADIMQMAMGWQLKANVQSAQPPVRAQLKVCMCANPQLCSVGEDDEDYAQGTMLAAVALELVLAARARAMRAVVAATRARQRADALEDEVRFQAALQARPLIDRGCESWREYSLDMDEMARVEEFEAEQTGTFDCEIFDNEIFDNENYAVFDREMFDHEKGSSCEIGGEVLRWALGWFDPWYYDHELDAADADAVDDDAADADAPAANDAAVDDAADDGTRTLTTNLDRELRDAVNLHRQLDCLLTGKPFVPLSDAECCRVAGVPYIPVGLVIDFFNGACVLCVRHVPSRLHARLCPDMVALVHSI